MTVRELIEDVVRDLPQRNLKTEEAAEVLGVSGRYLEDLRYRGGGPQFIRLGRRCVRYRPRDLARFIAERTVCSTSDRGDQHAA